MTAANPNPGFSSAPPAIATGPVLWIQRNLFNSKFNTVLTLVSLALILWGVSGFVPWAFTAADWSVIVVNWKLFFVGTYPVEALWRPWLVLELFTAMSGLMWGLLMPRSRIFGKTTLIVLGILAAIAVALAAPLGVITALMMISVLLVLAVSAFGGQVLGRSQPDLRNWLPLAWLGVFLVSMMLLEGILGMRRIPLDDFSGLLLTLLAATVSIVVSFPFGLMLALGRQSALPVVRWLSITYIEVIRGLPLIGILFMAQVMLPLVLPADLRLDRSLRAIAGLTLFSAAYLAESVRGGLQAVPRGQAEAARALGLNTPLVLSLVVLPQALKISIPTIVGQFISLFKDTSLLAIVGLAELVGISQSILANPKFIGRDVETYLFVALLFWAFCYGMSTISKRLE
jgi:general L-amino acid transport system permease protein